jgi:putative NADH-flavin reductase
MLELVVIGGGMIGQRIANEALDRGHRVTLVVRDPAKAAEIERAEMVAGDVLDTPGLAQHMAGRDVVVSAVGTSEDELLVGSDGESAISMEDYAVALVDEAETPGHIGRRFTVGY